MIDPTRATDPPETSQAAAPWTAGRPTDYARLIRPFDVIHSDTRGGITFDYPTGEQVRSRLNEELGPGGWESRIVREWVNAEADEVVVCMQLTLYILVADPNLPGEIVVRAIVKENYGSQKIKRSRSTGNPIDIGFDYKGAATDALKKCAAEIGIGLYLWKKKGGRLTIPDDGVPIDGHDYVTGDDVPRAQPPRQQPRASQPRQQPAPASQEAVGRYEAVRAEAVVAGFKTPWINDDPSRWTQPQLDGYTRQVENFLKSHQETAA